MQDPVVNIAGGDARDQRLWNSYVFWARDAFPEPIPAHVTIGKPSARLALERQRSLQAIVFSTFALEYRLRSVYAALRIQPRRRDGLWELSSNLESRAASMTGLDGKPIRF